MPERRYDSRRAYWTWVSTERAGRPHDFRSRDGVPTGSRDSCPFCPGNEAATTPEVDVDRPGVDLPNGPGWRVRVVTNLYPAVAPDSNAIPTQPSVPERREAGFGHHDVLIETTEHELHPSEYSDEQAELILAVHQRRCRRLAEDPRVGHIVGFQNFGYLSGASLRHPHQQIVALPDRPVSLRRSLTHQGGVTAPTCDDSLDPSRVVLDDDRFVAFVPFAPRSVGEVHIVPKFDADYLDVDRSDRVRLARMRQEMLRRMRRAFGDPDYNLILHAFDRRRESDGGRVEPRWRVEFVPRLALLGGFELATGSYITSVTPEEGARRLREAE